MLKQRVIIDSKDASSTVSGGFRWTLPGSIAKCDTFVINKVSLSNNFYQINQSNNKLIITYSSTDTTITITPGNYSDVELLAEIQTQLTAIAATLNIALGSNTQLITISDTGSTVFGIKLSQSTLNRSLGYGNTDLTGASTYTATNYFNNSWPFITLHSNNLTSDFTHNYMSDGRSNLIEVIPLPSKGDYIFYEPSLEYKYPFIVQGSFVQFDFYFRDPNGYYVDDIMKCRFMIELSFY